MKTLLKLMSVLACISILVSCEKEDKNGIVKHQCQHPLLESLPINAYFTTTFSKSIIPEGHIDLKGTVAELVQTGSGTDSEIGFFQIRLVCCLSLTDCIVGRSGGTLSDSRGNTLNIICKENLATHDFTVNFPSDLTHITGRFEFAGGTGRFADATGVGTIDCMVTADGTLSAMSHHWTGFVKNVRPE